MVDTGEEANLGDLDAMEDAKQETASGATDISDELLIPAGHQAIESIAGTTVVATFTTDTLVKSADASPLTEEMIQVEEAEKMMAVESFARGMSAESSQKQSEETNESVEFVFEFGKRDTHLKFSHPVEIVLTAPEGFSEGDTVDLSVIHA